MRRTRGVVLIDMLLAIMLLSVFMPLGYHLLRASFRVSTSTLIADDNAARFDVAMNLLRTDVNGGTSIEMPSASILRIHTAGNQPIDWREDHNLLLRTAGSQTSSWDLGQAVSLKLDGSVVLVTTRNADCIAVSPFPLKGNR